MRHPSFLARWPPPSEALTAIAAPRAALAQDPRAAVGSDDRLVCHACRAVVHQLHHKLKARPSRTHVEVLEHLESICDVSNLKIYEYIPPKMRKGCADFLGKHSGERALRHASRARRRLGLRDARVPHSRAARPRAAPGR